MSPIVATNHRAATGHRWRALHIATRTVAGSRPEPVFTGCWVSDELGGPDGSVGIGAVYVVDHRGLTAALPEARGLRSAVVSAHTRAVSTGPSSPIGSVAAAVAAGRTSAVSMVAEALDRIERLDPALNAVVALRAEAAYREAATIDAAIARGDPVGSARRRPGPGQGPRGRHRPADDPGVAPVRGRRAGHGGQRHPGPSAGGRRGHRRQDEPVGIRDRGLHGQPALRRDGRTHGPSPTPPVGPAVDRRRSSPPASSRSPRRPTAAVPSGSRPRSVGWSGSSRPMASSVDTRHTTGSTSRPSGRSPRRSRICDSSCRSRRARCRAIRRLGRLGWTTERVAVDPATSTPPNGRATSDRCHQGSRARSRMRFGR